MNYDAEDDGDSLDDMTRGTGTGKVPAMRLDQAFMKELWEEVDRLGAADHIASKPRSVFKARVLEGEVQSARKAWAMARMAGSAFPPPIARIRDREDYTWLMLGRLLRNTKQDLYAKLLATMTEYVKPRLESVHALRTLSRKYTLGDILDNWLAAELGEEEHGWLKDFGGPSGSRR